MLEHRPGGRLLAAPGRQPRPPRLFDSVAVATRPTPGQPVRRVLTYAPTSSTEWTPAATNWFVPNWFVDVTATLERKLAAFACFETERRDYPHPRNDRALRAHAEFFGAASAASTRSPSSSSGMWPEARRAQVAAAVVVAALLGGSAAAFAFTEHLKLEAEPCLPHPCRKHLGPNCRCQYRKIRIWFTLRKPDRLSLVVVDSDDHVVRTLLAATPVRAGRQRFGWDGRDDSGQVVPAGTTSREFTSRTSTGRS